MAEKVAVDYVDAMAAVDGGVAEDVAADADVADVADVADAADAAADAAAAG